MTNQDIYKQAKTCFLRRWKLEGIAMLGVIPSVVFAYISIPFVVLGMLTLVFNGDFFETYRSLDSCSLIVFVHKFVFGYCLATLVILLFRKPIISFLDKQLVKLFDQLTFSDDDIQEAIDALESREDVVWYRRVDQTSMTKVEIVRSFLDGRLGDFKKRPEFFAHQYFNDIFAKGGGQVSALYRIVWYVNIFCTACFCRRYDAETLRSKFISCANQLRNNENEPLVQAIIGHLKTLDFEMEFMHAVDKFMGDEKCIKTIIANCEKKTMPLRYLTEGKSAINYDVMVGDEFTECITIGSSFDSTKTDLYYMLFNMFNHGEAYITKCNPYFLENHGTAS